jgi:pseudouridine-5'-monophosphatase
MDGLLLNTEDLYSLCSNNILTKYARPPLPCSVKAQITGIHGRYTCDIFHDWAQLPISREQFKRELAEQQQLHFPKSKPLPGAEKLLSVLKNARTATGSKVEIALASGGMRDTFEWKASGGEAKRPLSMFDENRRILGSDDRLLHGRSKPAPDIYLLALQAINESRKPSSPPIMPEECLVFEDSVVGVEAGRRAWMRVVWVPHPELAAEYRGREKEVLPGRIGLVEFGDKWQLGDIDDGWAEQRDSLEMFPFEKFGLEGPKLIDRDETSDCITNLIC